MNSDIAGYLVGGLISFFGILILERVKIKRPVRERVLRALVIAVIGVCIAYGLRIVFPPTVVVGLLNLETDAMEKTYAEVKKYACGQVYTIDFAEAKTASAIEQYTCPFVTGTRTLPMTYAASEFLLAPEAHPGTRFMLQILSPGTDTIAVLVHDSTVPLQDGITAVSCGTTVITNGIAGNDYVIFDSVRNADKVSFWFVCAP